MSSVSSFTSENLKFPSQEAIISYLEQHPSTSKVTNPYLTEKKIIEAVAKVFADSTKTQMGIAKDVVVTTEGLNKTLKMRGNAVGGINMQLLEALLDCAEGKKFEEKTS